MLPEIEQLLILQDRDKKIRTLKTELELMPRQRKELDEKLSASETKQAEARQKGKENAVEKQKLEVDAQAKRDSIAKFRNQQFQTRKNEEFQALTNEIERYEKNILTIEDRELELMEQAEKLKIAISEAEKEFAAAKTKIQQQRDDLEAKEKTVRARLSEIETERNALSEKVDEDLLYDYDRIFTNKETAVVPLEHEVCMGCHMKMTAQISVRVRGAKSIVNCEQCGRILYHEE